MLWIREHRNYDVGLNSLLWTLMDFFEVNRSSAGGRTRWEFGKGTWRKGIIFPTISSFGKQASHSASPHLFYFSINKMAWQIFLCVSVCMYCRSFSIKRIDNFNYSPVSCYYYLTEMLIFNKEIFTQYYFHAPGAIGFQRFFQKGVFPLAQILTTCLCSPLPPFKANSYFLLRDACTMWNASQDKHCLKSTMAWFLHSNIQFSQDLHCLVHTMVNECPEGNFEKQPAQVPVATPSTFGMAFHFVKLAHAFFKRGCPQKLGFQDKAHFDCVTFLWSKKPNSVRISHLGVCWCEMSFNLRPLIFTDI